MSNARLYQVLKAPVISEKTENLSQLHDEYSVQVFKVCPDATKLEIKKAVELMFEGVQVIKVNTLNQKGKTKRFGRTVGRRNDTKKAYVTLKSINANLAAEELSETETATDE